MPARRSPRPHSAAGQPQAPMHGTQPDLAAPRLPVRDLTASQRGRSFQCRYQLVGQRTTPSPKPMGVRTTP